MTVGRSARAKDDGPTGGCLARPTRAVETGGWCSGRRRPALSFALGRLLATPPSQKVCCFREACFLQGGGRRTVSAAVTPEAVVSAATVTGRARHSSRLDAEVSSQADVGAAEVTTDMSWRPAGGRMKAVVCGRDRRTGLQNILDFGTAPHTSWLRIKGGSGGYRQVGMRQKLVWHDSQGEQSERGSTLEEQLFMFLNSHDSMLVLLHYILSQPSFGVLFRMHVDTQAEISNSIGVPCSGVRNVYQTTTFWRSHPDFPRVAHMVRRGPWARLLLVPRQP